MLSSHSSLIERRSFRGLLSPSPPPFSPSGSSSVTPEHSGPEELLISDVHPTNIPWPSLLAPLGLSSDTELKRESFRDDGSGEIRSTSPPSLTLPFLRP